MEHIRRTALWQMVIVLIFLGYRTAFTQVILHDPTWEAPGGYVQIASGESPGHIGGKTWVYSDFDSSSFASLFYVIGVYDYDHGPPETWTFNPAGPAVGTSFNGMTRLYYDSAASDLEQGIMIWSNTILIYDAQTSTDRSYKARFKLSVYDFVGIPVPLIAAISLDGMDARVGGAHQIVGNFTANWIFELSPLSSDNWQAAIPFFDGLRTDSNDRLQSSVTRAFYFVPVPGDFDADGDIDGLDLSDLIADISQLGIASFANNFGKAQ